MSSVIHGKVRLIEIPASDPQRSAEFYRKVFHWNIRPHHDGSLAFDDPSGALSGRFVQKRPPADQPGILIYILVESVAKAANAVMAAGGDIVQRIGVDAPDITARFKDPGGNILGLYQERKPSS